MEITARLYRVFDVQQVSATFRKREFVVEYQDSPNNPIYKQYISFSLVQDKVELISEYQVGEEIVVSFNLRGREWTSPSGEVKYFNTLECWRLTRPQGGGTQPADAPASYAPMASGGPATVPSGPAPAFQDNVEDDLPF
jgi:hypothetical protein